MRTHVTSSSHDGTQTDVIKSEEKHIPVLLQPVLENLKIKPDGVYFDGTLGGGGHAREIIARLSNKGVFVGVDKDEKILHKTERELKSVFHNSNSGTSPKIIWDVAAFEDIQVICKKHGLHQLDGALFDLGWGSHTLDSGKGFSFQKDEPLVMTYGTPNNETLTAYDIVNTWDLETLISIFRGWGEEPRAYKAAQAIVDARTRGPIRTTGELVAVLEKVLPRIGKVHPATKIFQALRIAVNNELEILAPAFTDALALLKPGGRLCIITFHSGEDRIVKHLFKRWDEEGKGEHVTRKVIDATKAEKESNPRARSAKLRVFEKAK